MRRLQLERIPAAHGIHLQQLQIKIVNHFELKDNFIYFFGQQTDKETKNQTNKEKSKKCNYFEIFVLKLRHHIFNCIFKYNLNYKYICFKFLVLVVYL